MVLRSIRGPKRDEVTGEWRRLHNEELSDLYCLPNIIQMFKSKSMEWTGHAASMRERRSPYRVLVGKLRERVRLEDPGLDEGIILNWIFRKWNRGGGHGLD